MKTFSRFMAYGAAVLTAGLLASCASTQVTSIKKDSEYNPRAMRHVLVIAVVKKPSTRRMLEDEFVRQLTKRGGEGVSSYTLVPEDTKLDEAAWKRVVSDNHFDSVIVSRLVDLEVIEKAVEPQYIQSNVGMGGYGYYNMGYNYMYQPGYSTRQETAAIETRVFEAAGEKQVWSAHSKTNIEEGRKPEAQVHNFVRHMLGKIYD